MAAFDPKRTFMVLDQMFANDPKEHHCPLGLQERTDASAKLASSSTASAIRARLHPPFCSDLLRFVFPRCVVRAVHSGVATFTSERGHRIACKRLFARNTRILSSTSGNEMSTATHISGCDLSTSRVSKVETPSLSSSTQAPSIYFLPPESMLNAVQRADILSNIVWRFMFSVVPTACDRVVVASPETSRVGSCRNMNGVN